MKKLSYIIKIAYGEYVIKVSSELKYLLKYGRQEHFTTYFFDHDMVCINKTQLKNEQKAASSPSQIRQPLDH